MSHKTLIAAAWLAAMPVVLHGCRHNQPRGEYTLRGIMGTDGSMVLTHPDGDADTGMRAAEAVADELSRLEAILSTWRDETPVSALNAAAAGRQIPLPPEAMDLLRQSVAIARASDGAFDITCRPVLRAWKQAAGQGRVPDAPALQVARDLVGPDQLTLGDGWASKAADGVEVDLGGIAKGYAMDVAVAVLRKRGIPGGLVELGGDISCYGVRAEGGKWRIQVLDPFDPEKRESLGIIELAEGSVCTSGNYYRYSEIAGRRYSHIVDPRSGWPVDEAPSVTVVAPDGATADAWATALSVLGEQGLASLPKGVEAVLLLGTPRQWRIVQTPGFEALWVQPPKATASPE